jgi:hypothetical protein
MTTVWFREPLPKLRPTEQRVIALLCCVPIISQISDPATSPPEPTPPPALGQSHLLLTFYG